MHVSLACVDSCVIITVHSLLLLFIVAAICSGFGDVIIRLRDALRR